MGAPTPLLFANIIRTENTFQVDGDTVRRAGRSAADWRGCQGGNPQGVAGLRRGIADAGRRVKMLQNGLHGLRRRHLSQLHLLQPQFLQVLQPPSKTKGSPHWGQSMLSAVTFF